MAGEGYVSPRVQYYFTLFCDYFARFTLALFPFFVLDLFIPITVDSKPSWNTLSLIPSSPLLNNVLLLAIFVIQHSVMARKPLKRAILNRLPNGFEKAIFALVSGLCMLLMYTCWLPMATYAFWAISNQWLYYGVIGLNLLVNFTLVKTMTNLKHVDLHGAKIAKERLEGKQKSSSDSDKLPPVKLVRKGFYGIVRHPLMFLQMLIQWVSPTMTVGHALWSGILTTYIVVAVVFFEEPALVEEFGEDYKQYMKEVPRFIPDPRSLFDGNKKD